MLEKILQQSGISATTEKTAQESTAADTGAKTPQETKPHESKSFAALAKRERAILEEQKRTKAEREQLSAERKEYEAWKAAKAEAKRNPKKFMEANGLTYEELTNFHLNDERPTPESEIQSVKEELSNWKKQQEEDREKQTKEQIEREQAAYQKTIDDYKESINEMVAADTTKYELINLYEAKDLVFETIEGHFNEQLKLKDKDPSYKPKVLSKEEAADIVEKFLEDEYSEKASKSAKLKAKLGIKSEEKKETESIKGETWGARTLTNEAISSAPSLLNPKTENDRLKRAMAALGGN